MKSSIEIPESNLDKFSKNINPKIEYQNWYSSLEPCYIIDSEFKKMHDYLISEKIINTFTRDFNIIIEVTDIVTDNDGLITFKLKYEANDKIYSQSELISLIKECDFSGLPLDIWIEDKFGKPKSEANEAVLFAEWILDNTSQILGSRLRSYYVGGLLHGEYTTQELYEIFKQGKK